MNTLRSPLLLLLLAAAPAFAQTNASGDSTAVAGRSRPGAGPQLSADCQTGRIEYIFVDNHSIFDTSDPDLDERFAWAYGIANALHVRTREGVIRRELLFSIGDCYDPYLLEESERLLRAHNFLARIDVYGVQQPNGSYHIVVDTNDEWSTQVDARVKLQDGLKFEGISIAEKNVLGTGQALEVFYLEREVTRDYGVRYSTPQLGSTRWDLSAAVGRTRAGTFVEQSVGYPFVGEVGRWGMMQRFEREDRFFDYVAGEDADGTVRVLLPLRAKAFDVALVSRHGRRGNLLVFGGALGYEALRFPGDLQVARGDDYGDHAAADSVLGAELVRQTDEVNNIRAFLLIGQRHVQWVRRRGLDALRGVQDVRLGSEVELALGRTLSALRRRDDDLFASLTVETGFEAGRALHTFRFNGDARRDLEAALDASEWQDVIADAEAFAYWQPRRGGRHTLVTRLAGAGGWHTRTPFQLTLGGETALRGYDRDRFPGGRRVVYSLEERMYFGWPLPDVLDLGGTAFVDVGRIWPGDAPYGVDSGWRGSGGLGLRGAFPAGGRTTYRLDVAVPFEPDAFRNYRVIFSIGERLGLRGGTPDQLERSRRVGAGRELLREQRRGQ